MIIESINKTDYEALHELFMEFARFEGLEACMTNSVDLMKTEGQYLQGFTAKDEAGKIVGYVTFFYAYYTWTGKCLYMDDLYIKPGHRGQGLGTLLIQKVMDHAKEAQCHKMRWQVSNWNTHAIAFYEKLGAKFNLVEMNCDLALAP